MLCLVDRRPPITKIQFGFNCEKRRSTGLDHRLNRPQPTGPPFVGTDPEHRRSSWGQSIDEHGLDMDTVRGDVPDS